MGRDRAGVRASRRARPRAARAGDRDPGDGRLLSLDAALRRVEVWPPDLDPDDRYVPIADVDLDALATRVGARLGGPPARVGQSAVVMGLASRLWSVTVVPAVRDGVLAAPAQLVVRDDDGAVVLGVRPGDGVAAPGVDDVRVATVDVLAPIVAALPLAGRLLWGNVAASLHAVPRVHGLTEAWPLVRALLDTAPLAGELADPDAAHTRRRTCCLFYQVPGAGLCGDCVFTEAPRD